MKISEYLRMQNNVPKKHNDEEHRIQTACVEWFRLSHPKYQNLLFAIPNGGRRDAVTGRKMKEEGVLAGVADLFLALASNGKHGLFIEMKTRKGTQQQSQKDFEKNVTKQGYEYSICRSLDEFSKVIETYLRYGKEEAN